MLDTIPNEEVLTVVHAGPYKPTPELAGCHGRPLLAEALCRVDLKGYRGIIKGIIGVPLKRILQEYTKTQAVLNAVSLTLLCS